MNVKKSLWKMKIKWFVAFVLVSACVDPITFNVPTAQLLTVVEGMISDSPGPYTVTLSQGISLDSDSTYRPPVQHAKITLFDDEGNTEAFTELNPGEYVTSGAIQGKVGHAYHIRIEMADGKIFESEPDKINPVGAVENIRYEYEARTIKQTYGDIDANVFNIYVDAEAGDAVEKYVRWRFTGTYKVVTYPELHYTWNPPYTPYKDPFPCSGYILVGGPIGSGGLLQKVGECECCTCWVNDLEPLPQLSDTQLISGTQFNNIKVGEVPINTVTFYDKYMVDVEQMSLSKHSFDFFKLIRKQKETASSLFQPPAGEIRGNINAVNNNESVVGIFWASSIMKKTIFIQRSDVPYNLPPTDSIYYACTAYPNSSNVKPKDWQ
jgi:Domain of unknown function (DUF4249)